MGDKIRRGSAAKVTPVDGDDAQKGRQGRRESDSFRQLKAMVDGVMSSPGDGNDSDDSFRSLTLWKIQSSELEIGNYVASGSFGDVCEAMFRGTKVAVKTMVKNKVTPDNLARFKEELLLSRDLRHPNILSFYGTMLDGASFAIVLTSL